MNLLDQAIELFSPKWAAERLAHREMLLSYRSSRRTRVSGRGRVLASGADGQLETSWDRRKMVDRSRQLERDSPIAGGLFDRSCDNVVGPQGIRPKSICDDENFRNASRSMFMEWANDRRAVDVRGMSNLWELQRLLFRSKQRDGDVAQIKTSTGHLQSIESHQIVSPTGITISNRSVDGIELDSRGGLLRFHIAGAPKDRARRGRNNKTSTISAADVIFDPRRVRLNQTRGTPILSGTAHVFDQVDGYLEAVITAARMSACFGLVLHSKNKHRGLPTERDIDGNDVKKLRVEPARIWRLGQDDKVTQIQPNQPGSQFGEITATFGRLVGTPFGMPLEVAHMDFSRTNYSSARAALLQAYRAWRVMQNSFIWGTLDPIWRWKITGWLESGALVAPGGFTLEQLLANEWQGPGWSWIDPVKEITAALMAVDGGLDTLQDLATRMGGGDWFKLLDRRAEELEAIAKKGIEVGRSTKTRDAGEGAGEEDGADEDEDQDDDNPKPGEPGEDDDE